MLATIASCGMNCELLFFLRIKEKLFQVQKQVNKLCLSELQKILSILKNGEKILFSTAKIKISLS